MNLDPGDVDVCAGVIPVQPLPDLLLSKCRQGIDPVQECFPLRLLLKQGLGNHQLAVGQQVLR